MAQAQKKQEETEIPAEGAGTAISLIPENINPVEVFTPAGIDKILGEVRRIALSEVRDMSTALGRKNIAALAHKVAKSKTALDNMGESLIEDARKKVSTINAERKKVRETLDALKEEIRAPLTEWEDAEENRMAEHERALAALEAKAMLAHDKWMSLSVDDMQADLNAIMGDNNDYQEFSTRHEIVKKNAVAAFENAIAKRQKHDADQAELERLRKSDEDRKRKEREDQIAKDAADQARREAEADKLESERKQRAAEEETKRAKEAEEKAKRDLAEAEDRRLREAKEAEEKAVRIQKENEERAERERKANEERIDRERREAAEAERKRIEDAQREEDAKARKREEDKKHHAKVNNAALEFICAIIEKQDGSTSTELGQAIVSAIARGEVPHTKISY